MIDIARRASILGILAVGMTFLFVAGELDLSIGSHYGFLLILMSYQNEGLAIDPAIAALVVIVIGMGIGAINGFFVTRIGLPSFIMTLGMLALLRGASNAISSGYPIPAKNTDLPFYQIIRASFPGTPVPNIFIAMLIVMAIGAVILARTKFGSDVYATGGNPAAARSNGIDTARVKFRCFVAMGGLCGLAAAMLFGRVGLAPLNAGVNLELQVIAAIIVGGVGLFGGRGTIFGSLMGVLIISMITSGLDPHGCPAILGRRCDRRSHPGRRRAEPGGSRRHLGPAGGGVSVSTRYFAADALRSCRRERLLGRRQRAGRGGTDRPAACRRQSRRARQPWRDPPPPLHQRASRPAESS